MTQYQEVLTSLNNLIDKFTPTKSTQNNISTEWNLFANRLRDDLGLPEQIDIILPGTGINLTKIIESLLFDPGETMIFPYLDIEIPLILLVVAAYITWRTPWVSIFGFSIPIGAIIIALYHDTELPISSWANAFIETPYSESLSGFTGLDAGIDYLIGDAISYVSKWLLENAKNALWALFQVWAYWRRPKVRDILERVKMTGCDDELDPESETALRVVIDEFNTKFNTWLAYLNDPAHNPRPS